MDLKFVSGSPWFIWATLGHAGPLWGILAIVVSFIWTVYELYITVIVDANVVQHGGTWNTMGVGPIEFEWKAARPSRFLLIENSQALPHHPAHNTHSFKILNASIVQEILEAHSGEKSNFRSQNFLLIENSQALPHPVQCCITHTHSTYDIAVSDWLYQIQISLILERIRPKTLAKSRAIFLSVLNKQYVWWKCAFWY